MKKAILLISCPDRRGVTAAVTNFIFEHNGNIEDADQHIDQQRNIFFMRIKWSLDGFSIEEKDLESAFAPIAEKFNMQWEVYLSHQRPRVAVFVSQRLHCLYDLLMRQKSGQLPCDIALIVSNHAEVRSVAEEFGIHFFHSPKNPDNKAAQEEVEIARLKEEKIDMVVLARYHQIFTKRFVEAFENQMINIHHSFLPAFPGKNPYARAYEKGVKVIGATCHYVTEDLDEGPIIEQETVRISHRDSLEDLKRRGEDLEKAVLNRALRWVLERKVLTYGNKTVVFY